MHQDPEHEDYDDDEYKYYPDQYDKNGSYKGFHKQFSFDWSAWKSWLKDAMEDIIEADDGSWIIKPIPIVSNTNYDLVEGFLGNNKKKTFVYIGNNAYNEPIWKNKYFVCNKLNVEWMNHVSSRPGYFVQQPNYYKGLFDILN